MNSYSFYSAQRLAVQRLASLFPKAILPGNMEAHFYHFSPQPWPVRCNRWSAVFGFLPVRMIGDMHRLY
jgi:hypothetical protein